jgi:hypothetical protein
VAAGRIIIMEKEPCREKNFRERLIKSESPRVAASALCPAHIIKSRLKAKGCIIFPIGVRVCEYCRIFTRRSTPANKAQNEIIDSLSDAFFCGRVSVLVRTDGTSEREV